MNQSLINRYQPGGDIYAALASKYSTATANSVAQAALSGDEGQVNTALTNSVYGQPLDTSVASILYDQLTTDPLGAPLAGAEKIAANSLIDFIKSPAVLFVLGLILFFALGGFSFLARQLAKK